MPPGTMSPGTMSPQHDSAIALHPHPVVRAQVSVLRFQFAQRAANAAAARIRRCAAARPRSGSAAARRTGTLAEHLLRWRHAEPVHAGQHRAHPRWRGERGSRLPPTSRSRWRPIPARSSTAASPAISRAGVNRISFGVQSFDDDALQAHRPHPRRGAGRARGQAGAGCRYRQSQPRPDVCVAAADAGRRAGRCGKSASAANAAFVALPADPGTEHAVRGQPAAAAGRRQRLGHAGSLSGAAGRRPVWRSTKSRHMRVPAASARTT